MDIDITYNGALRCTAKHGPSGATIVTDAPLDNGGKGEAFSPTDLAAAAVGTCTATIMGLMTERSGLDLAGTKIHVEKEMVTAPKRRIGKLVITVTFPKGLEISDSERAKLEKTINLCPVKQSLHPDIEVVAEYIYQ